MADQNEIDYAQLSDEELLKIMTDKQEVFCHQYIIDWNATRAAKAAGYSEDSAKVIGYQNYTKLYIQEYINRIKDNYAKEAGISKIKQLKELAKIAYSSISNMHESWIERKVFEDISEEQRAAIESIDTKILKKNIGDDEIPEIVDVEYVKIKLYSKLTALSEINKMLGYNDPEKHDHTTKGESINRDPFQKIRENNQLDDTNEQAEESS